MVQGSLGYIFILAKLFSPLLDPRDTRYEIRTTSNGVSFIPRQSDADVIVTGISLEFVTLRDAH